MCTLSYLPQPGGFILWHSRDERRTRAPALPPRVERQGRVSRIAPRDGDLGGTWTGVNSLGVAVGLANLFLPAPAALPPGKISRGLLLAGLLDSPSVKEVERRVSGADLPRYDGFTLVAMDSSQRPMILRWDRERLLPSHPLGPTLLVTSSGGGEAFVRARQRIFDEAAPSGPLDADRIEALYRTHPAPDAPAICLHHPQASTVSLTRIEVAPSAVSMIYTPGPPCLTPAGTALTVQRET